MTSVSAYDNTLEIIDTFDPAQAKFQDILDSPSIEVACEKIESLSKAKQLDSSLILLITSAWASAKESKTMKNEVRFSTSAIILYGTRYESSLMFVFNSYIS